MGVIVEVVLIFSSRLKQPDLPLGECLPPTRKDNNIRYVEKSQSGCLLSKAPCKMLPVHDS